MVQFRGVNLSQQTIDMLNEAEKLSGATFTLSQGSWSGAAASAGTHSGSGAVDIRGLRREEVLLALRRVGFAAWQRTEDQGDWGPHIHAIVLDDPDASKQAKDQMEDYREGRNGLANNRPDDGPRLTPIPTWASYNRNNQEDDDVSAAEVWGYKNEELDKRDMRAALVNAERKATEAAKDAAYAREQLKSIAAGMSMLTAALIDGTVDIAELRKVNAELSGKGEPGLIQGDPTPPAAVKPAVTKSGVKR